MCLGELLCHQTIFESDLFITGMADYFNKLCLFLLCCAYPAEAKKCGASERAVATMRVGGRL